MIYAFIGICILLAYIITCIIKFKCIPPSVSETFYLGAGYWFTVTLFVSAILIIIGLLELSIGSPFQFLSFFTGAGMAFVGAAPWFHDSEKTIHTIGAIVLLTGSQIWLSLFVTPWLLLGWLITPLCLLSSKRIFLIELLCLILVLIGLFI